MLGLVSGMSGTEPRSVMTWKRCKENKQPEVRCKQLASVTVPNVSLHSDEHGQLSTSAVLILFRLEAPSRDSRHPSDNTSS